MEKRLPNKVRLMASLLGKINSMRRSHGNVTAIISHKTQQIVGKVVYYNDWEASCVLDQYAIEELKFLFLNFESQNGTKIFI